MNPWSDGRRQLHELMYYIFFLVITTSVYSRRKKAHSTGLLLSHACIIPNKKNSEIYTMSYIDLAQATGLAALSLYHCFGNGLSLVTQCKIMASQTVLCTWRDSKVPTPPPISKRFYYSLHEKLLRYALWMKQKSIHSPGNKVFKDTSRWSLERKPVQSGVKSLNLWLQRFSGGNYLLICKFNSIQRVYKLTERWFLKVAF